MRVPHASSKDGVFITVVLMAFIVLYWMWQQEL
jgi:hypothetical protein